MRDWRTLFDFLYIVSLYTWISVMSVSCVPNLCLMTPLCFSCVPLTSSLVSTCIKACSLCKTVIVGLILYFCWFLTKVCIIADCRMQFITTVQLLPFSRTIFSLQLFCLRSYGTEDLAVYIILLIVCGIFINGPYGMITTAVSSDLVGGQRMYFIFLQPLSIEMKIHSLWCLLCMTSSFKCGHRIFFFFFFWFYRVRWGMVYMF